MAVGEFSGDDDEGECCDLKILNLYIIVLIILQFHWIILTFVLYPL